MAEGLQIKRGDDWEIDIEISDPDGEAIDFTGSTLTVALSRRNDLESRQAAIIALHSNTNRLTVSYAGTPAKAIIRGVFRASETTTLSVGYLYLWLISCSAPGEKITWIREAIQIV